MTSLLELDGIVKSFETDPPIRPLDGVSLAIEPGRLVAITGVSGRGKSTLLNVAGGLLSPTSGAVRFKGEDIYALPGTQLDALHRRGIGFIFQSPHLFQALTAWENLAFSQKVCGASGGKDAVDQALEEVGLADRASHLPCELSVGQRRRLVIARTFLAEHDLILADEPTNDLDEEWSDRIFERFRTHVAGTGKSVVVVTHDTAYARLADTVYVLENGILSRRDDV